MPNQITPIEALNLLKSAGIRFEKGHPPSSEELCMRLLAELGGVPSYHRSFYSAICALAFIEEQKRCVLEVGDYLDQVADKLNKLTDADFHLIDPVKVTRFCALEAVRKLGE